MAGRVVRSRSFGHVPFTGQCDSVRVEYQAKAPRLKDPMGKEVISEKLASDIN